MDEKRHASNSALDELAEKDKMWLSIQKRVKELIEELKKHQNTNCMIMNIEDY